MYVTTSDCLRYVLDTHGRVQNHIQGLFDTQVYKILAKRHTCVGCYELVEIVGMEMEFPGDISIGQVFIVMLMYEPYNLIYNLILECTSLFSSTTCLATIEAQVEKSPFI